MKIIQITPNLSYGDAVGNDILSLLDSSWEYADDFSHILERAKKEFPPFNVNYVWYV